MDSRKREDRLAPDGWSTRLAAPGVRATRARCSERIGGAIIAMQWFRVFETVDFRYHCIAMVRRRYRCIAMVRVRELLQCNGSPALSLHYNGSSLRVLATGRDACEEGSRKRARGRETQSFFCIPLSDDVVSVVRSSLAL